MNELMIKKFRESCDYNIVLIGFMGAGKSTVARTLGEWFDMEIEIGRASCRERV